LIDLHTHILHAVDDGAQTLADAVAMARMAAAQGVTTMVATPHGHSSISAWAGYSVAKISNRIEELRVALAAAGVPLALVLGTEIFGEPGALERLRAGQVLPYGESRAVLVEFPLGITRGAAEQIVFTFQAAGHRVVIAHPERYRFAQDDPNTLAPLVERGALMQLTGDALLGNQGEPMRRLAEQLLAHGLVQVLATDAHGPHFRRMPNLGEARARAAKLAGAAVAETLTRTTPAAILADTPIVTPAPTPIRGWRGMR
jgi:protein-tyrosine phosphatase